MKLFNLHWKLIAETYVRIVEYANPSRDDAAINSTMSDNFGGQAGSMFCFNLKLSNLISAVLYVSCVFFDMDAVSRLLTSCRISAAEIPLKFDPGIALPLVLAHGNGPTVYEK